MKKYELTDETKLYNGRTLHRIVALRSFGWVNKGDKGGWIEKEENLSHEGNCWVNYEAKVLDDAKVLDNACLLHRAELYDRACLHHDAAVGDQAILSGNAGVFNFAKVYRKALVHNAKLSGEVVIKDNATVYGNVIIRNAVTVCEDAKISSDDMIIGGLARFCGDAKITGDRDYIVFKNWWSSGRYFTWTRSNNMWSVGCFYGTGDELIKKAYEDSEDKGKHYEEIVEYVNKCVLKEEYYKKKN